MIFAHIDKLIRYYFSLPFSLFLHDEATQHTHELLVALTVNTFHCRREGGRGGGGGREGGRRKGGGEGGREEEKRERREGREGGRRKGGEGGSVYTCRRVGVRKGESVYKRVGVREGGREGGGREGGREVRV